MLGWLAKPLRRRRGWSFPNLSSGFEHAVEATAGSALSDPTSEAAAETQIRGCVRPGGPGLSPSEPGSSRRQRLDMAPNGCG